MGKLLLGTEAAPATPAAGKTLWFPDSTAKLPGFVNEAGKKLIIGGSANASIANQSPGAADAYLTDSDLLIPSFGFQARTMFRWVISASKTAAGTATPIWQVRIGAARTTGDTSRLTLTGSAQTAVADVGVWTIYLVVRSIGAAGVLQGTLIVNHNAAATGFASNDAGAVEATSAGFDMSAIAGQFVGLSLNAGASAAWTVTQVRANAEWN